jgi:hypothetical protein
MTERKHRITAVAGVTVVLCVAALFAFASPGPKPNSPRHQTTSTLSAPAPRSSDAPATVGGLPSLAHPPAGASQPLGRIRFTSRVANASCGARLDLVSRAVVATIVCRLPSSRPVGVWSVSRAGRERFLGYPLVGPKRELRTALPIPDLASVELLLITRETPGKRGRRPGPVVARAQARR